MNDLYKIIAEGFFKESCLEINILSKKICIAYKYSENVPSFFNVTNSIIEQSFAKATGGIITKDQNHNGFIYEGFNIINFKNNLINFLDNQSIKKEIIEGSNVLSYTFVIDTLDTFLNFITELNKHETPILIKKFKDMYE
jgi:hypothetical protein